MLIASRILIFLLFTLSLATEVFGAGLAFRPADDGGFSFDTGLLKGRLRAGGKSIGLSGVTHGPTGLRLDRSMGLLSHYRVFTVGQRYGTGAWDWPSEARLLENGAVLAAFPGGTNRPFDMEVEYRLTGPSAIEAKTTVRANAALRGFEVFVASYFSETFTNAAVWARDPAEAPPRFISATKADADWHMFPASPQHVALIQDGRWKLEPHPVAWTIRPVLGAPLAVRRSPSRDLTALLMASREAFAIALPYETEGHYSTYFSLFGRDVAAGETVSARTQLAIRPGDARGEALAAHRAFSQPAR